MCATRDLDADGGRPVDLLLITWNRRPYVEKTLARLLADPAEFRLHCWDNASQDGTADVIAGIADPRVVYRHFSRENVRQREPTLWFLDHASSDLGGKIDDDILLPSGWIEKIAPALRRERRLGMVGCWVFMPEDWDDALAARNCIELGGVRVLRTVGRAGQSFLARLEHLRRYMLPPGASYGFPIDQAQMTLDGLVNGNFVPPLFAHNMDDPRSEHCLMQGSVGAQGALTARVRGFKTLAEYEAWIRADARAKLSTPFEDQLAALRRNRDPSLRARVRRKWARLVAGLTRRG